MTGFRVFRSGGDCVHDDPPPGGWDQSTDEATTAAQEWLGAGLYVHQEPESGRLIWYFKASDGVEYQFLAEYIDPESSPETVAVAAGEKLVAFTDRHGWELRGGDSGGTAVQPGLTGPATEPRADPASLREDADLSSPVEIGAGDTVEALAVYRALRDDRSVQVARTGVNEAFPAADVVVVPDGSAPGEPTGATAAALAGRSATRLQERAADRLAAALRIASPDRVAAAVDAPGGVEVSAEGSSRSPAFALAAGAAVAAGAYLSLPVLPVDAGPRPVVAVLAAALVGTVAALVRSVRDDELPQSAREPVSEFERALEELVDGPADDPERAVEEALAGEPLTTGDTGGSRLVVGGAYALGAAASVVVLAIVVG